jgi:hypothetical protein
LSRGTLQSVKEGGTVYALLPSEAPRNAGRNVDDTPPSDTTALISAKDDLIATLQEQLAAERQSSAELRRIVAGLTRSSRVSPPDRTPLRKQQMFLRSREPQAPDLHRALSHLRSVGSRPIASTQSSRGPLFTVGVVQPWRRSSRLHIHLEYEGRLREDGKNGLP